MASSERQDGTNRLNAVKWPLRLTRLGMVAEAVVQSFWPLMTVVLLVLAALMLGVQDGVLVEVEVDRVHGWGGAQASRTDPTPSRRGRSRGVPGGDRRPA